MSKINFRYEATDTIHGMLRDFFKDVDAFQRSSTRDKYNTSKKKLTRLINKLTKIQKEDIRERTTKLNKSIQCDHSFMTSGTSIICLRCNLVYTDYIDDLNISRKLHKEIKKCKGK